MGDLSWASILGALGGLAGLAALINSLTNAKRSHVESLVDTINAQDKRIAYLEKQLAIVRRRYYRLLRWIRAQGLEPPFDEEEHGADQ